MKYALLSLFALLLLVACDSENEAEKNAKLAEKMANAEHFYKGIHPLCFARLEVDGGQDSVDTQNCEDGYEISKIEYNPRTNMNMVTYRLSDSEADSQSQISYRYVGPYKDYDIIQTISNGGGTEIFTGVIAVEVEGNKLNVREHYAGGDRCNGGITFVNFTPDDKLAYGQNLTAYDLMTIDRLGYKDEITAYDDLSNCAACCYGQVRYENNKPVSVSLDGDVRELIEQSGEKISEDTKQACFDRHIHGRANTVKTSWTMEDWKTIQDQIYKNCFQ